MKHLLRFIQLAKPHWHWLLGGILLSVTVLAANALLMALSGWFIASMAVAGASGAAFNFFFSSAGIRFLAITRTVGRYAERLVTHSATFRILAVLRPWLFVKAAKLGPAGLEHYADGDLAGRMRVDIDSLENIYLRVLLPLASGGIVLIGGLIFIASFSLYTALLLLPVMLIAALLLPLVIRRKAQKPGEKTIELAADLRNRVTEGIQGIEELMLLGVTDQHADTVEKLSAELVDSQQQLARTAVFASSGIIGCSGVAALLVLAMAGLEVSTTAIPGPWLVMLLLFSLALFEAIGQLPAALHQLPAALASAGRIFELVDTNAPSANPEDISNLHTDLQSRQEESSYLVFNNVTAGYHDDNVVLHDFSLQIPAGGKAVIIGASGIGKSLVAEILSGFRQYKGSIKINGAELAEMSEQDLRNTVAALPQHPHIFNSSIGDNLLLDNRSITTQELNAALKDSGLDLWIETLPDRLDTQVGINGSAISGGEGRRIALARALLKNTPLLLLDEPGEGLDRATEQRIIQRLQKRFKSADTTVLIISHRPAWLALADQIISVPANAKDHPE